jgi:arylsulfatase A-like enzyme
LLFSFAIPVLANQELPNIIILFADDQGYADIGCFGAKGFETPNLDQLAREGRRFTSFYSASAICTPSRAALLTGCYPVRTGMTDVLFPWSTEGLNENEVTIAEMLKQKGYATACVGKWHLGYQKKFLPQQHGFDIYFGLPYSNDMRPDMNPDEHPKLPLIEGNEIIEYNPSQSLLTRQYTDKVIHFIEKNQEKPFFVYLPYTMPHIPLYVSHEYRNRSKNGIYGDVIMEMDGSVGRIVDKLKKLNLDQNTLVIYTSDNGPWLSYGTHGGSAWPLREGKFTVFEGGQRVPCIMWMPARIKAGTVCDNIVSTIDLFPTIASMVGTDLPDHTIDGVDAGTYIFKDVLTESLQKPFFYFVENDIQAVRQGKWKLHRPHYYQSVTDPGTDGRIGRVKQRRTSWALFNLEEDIGERINVADLHPEVVNQLKLLMIEFESHISDSKRPAGKI